MINLMFFCIVLLLFVCLSISIPIYYFYLFSEHIKAFNKKKEFILSFIPFWIWIKEIKKVWRNLK